MLAVLTQPDRTPRLRSVNVPALVLHGMVDRMVHASGGRSTAAAIPGAELVLVDGMGHDLPPATLRHLRRPPSVAPPTGPAPAPRPDLPTALTGARIARLRAWQKSFPLPNMVHWH